MFKLIAAHVAAFAIAFCLTLVIRVAITATPDASTEIPASVGLVTSTLTSESRILGSEAWDTF